MENKIFDMTGTPSYILYNAGIESGLYNAATLWDTLTETIDAVDSPSKLLDYEVEEKDVYSAIIFNMFESATDYKIMSCIDNEVTTGTKKFVSTVTSMMKNLYGYDYLADADISNLSEKDKEQLISAMKDSFKIDHPDAASIGKLTSVISDGIEYAKNLQSYCEMVETYYSIWCLSDSMKSVMKEMCDRCPLSEPELRMALSECVSVMNSSERAFAAKMTVDFYGVVGKDVSQYMIDKMWDSVKDSLYLTHPGAYVLMTAYKAGKYASNVLYNADDVTEKYFKLAAVVKSEDLLSGVYKSLKTKYQADKTELKAEIYNSVVDVVFNALNTDCDYAYSFADSVGSALAGKINAAMGDTSVEDIKTGMSSVQNNYYKFHESVLTDWLYELENDYPDEYASYSHLLDESWERIKKKYDIHCPVDVYIYNAGGELEGSVVDNVPYCSGNKNITVSVSGDKKTVYFYNNEPYDIVYVGNDEGKMDIAITEYDENQSEIRNVYFNDMALSKDLTYSSADSGSVEEYSVKDESSQSITADYDSKQADNTTYTVSLERGYFNDFAVSAELHAGENAYITAYVPEGYAFAGWTSDAGEDIFEDASSVATKICMLAHDVNITANIVECPRLTLSDITDSSVTVTARACDDIHSGVIVLAVYDNNGALINVIAKNFEQAVTFDNIDLNGNRVKAML